MDKYIAHENEDKNYLNDITCKNLDTKFIDPYIKHKSLENVSLSINELFKYIINKLVVIKDKDTIIKLINLSFYKDSVRFIR